MDRIGWDGQGGEKYRVAPQSERAVACGCDWTVGDQKNTFLAPKRGGVSFRPPRRRRFFSRFSVEELAGRQARTTSRVLSSSGTYLVASHISIHSAFFLLKISNILALSECLSSV